MVSMDSQQRREPSARVHIAILVVVGLVLWVFTCGLWDLHGPDEGRYVQVAKELLIRGNWLVLTIGGDVYDEKLPPPFWVLATMLRLSGGEPSAWLLRLPAVLAAIATVVLTYFIGRRLYGWRAGWIAAWILMSTPLVLEHAPEARLDMIFTAFITLSLAAWLTREPGRTISLMRAAVMWGAVAAAIFYKGPLAVIVVLSVVAFEARAKRSWRVFLDARAHWGLIAIALIFTAWYALQERKAGSQFAENQLWEQIWERFFYGDHPEWPWYYPVRLIGAFFPWSLVLIPVAIDFWRRRAVPEPVRSITAWFLIPFIFLTIASGKRQVYLLPLMPALALLVGWWLAPRLSKARSPKWAGGWAGAILIAVGAALPIFYSILRLSPRLADETHLTPTAGILIASAGIGLIIIYLGVWLMCRSADPPRLFAAVVAASLLIGFSGYACMGPARNDYASTREFAQRLDFEMRERNLSTLGGVESGAKTEFFLYGHYPPKRFEEEELRGEKPISRPLTDVIVIEEEDVDHIAPVLARENYRELFGETVTGDKLRVYVRQSVTSVTQ